MSLSGLARCTGILATRPGSRRNSWGVAMDISEFGWKVGLSLVALAEAIEAACVGVRAGCERLKDVMRDASESAMAGLRLFAEAYVDLAAKAYLRTHRRLPGSERTARLRKKRRVVLLRWFLRYVEGCY